MRILPYALVGLVALSCAPPDPVGFGRSLLTGPERRERAGMIRDVAADRGITQGWLLAGIADAETSMSHCWSELTWACMGPASVDCGGGPVVAGAGDGPCPDMQGGLGMFQFDAGTYTETLAREGDRILTIGGNVDAAIDFVIAMVIRSTFIDGVDTEAQAIEWMNGVRIDNERFQPWYETVTRYYNGCSMTASCWPTRVERYRQFAEDVHAEMGAGFWSEAMGFEHAGVWVAQTFPLASEPFVIAPGWTVTGYIELRNAGSATWEPGRTFLATTEPRGGASPLAGPDWFSPDRAATVGASVAPGQIGRFAFSVSAPLAAGDYSQFFGLVEDGADPSRWFADEGGPPDDQLQLRVTVDPTVVPPNPDGGVPEGGVPPRGDDGGCVVAPSGRSRGSATWALFLAVGAALVGRRRR